MNQSRIEELERAERKLQALEAGGVDNWEFYGEALSDWHKDNEHDISPYPINLCAGDKIAYLGLNGKVTEDAIISSPSSKVEVFHDGFISRWTWVYEGDACQRVSQSINTPWQHLDRTGGVGDE